METALLFTAGVLIVAVGIIISIALHEIGHLVPAKLFGVRTPQYMIGFGPKIFSRTKGETEYGVKAVPLGGYVSMVGMFPPLSAPERKLAKALKRKKEDEEDAEPEDEDGYSEYSEADKKLLESSGFLKKKWLSASLDAREESSKEVLDTDEGRMFYQLPVWKKLIIMIGGPAMNGVLAFGILAAVISIHGINQTTLTVSDVYECFAVEDEATEDGANLELECDDDTEPTPAMQAGYLPGDTYVKYADVEPESWEHVQEITQQSAGETLPVVLERDGELIETEVTPLSVPRPVFNDLTGRPEFDDDGNMLTENVGMVGTRPEVELTQLNPLEAGPMLWDQIEAVSRVIAVLPARLYDVAESTFNEDIPRDLDGPVSVVGVGRIAGEMSTLDEMTLEARLASVLTLVSSVNIALMLFNLLIPLPPLDGGHVAGALFEGLRKMWARLRGKPEPEPLDVSKMMPVTYLMAFLLLCTGALLIIADIVDPISLFDQLDY